MEAGRPTGNLLWGSRMGAKGGKWGQCPGPWGQYGSTDSRASSSPRMSYQANIHSQVNVYQASSVLGPAEAGRERAL